MDQNHNNLIGFTAEIAAAFAANQRCTAEELAALVPAIYRELAGLGPTPEPVAPEEPIYQPAVSVRSSIKPDCLISLIDGKAYKSLKRHLSGHGLTPEQYRERYGLKPDYPMVAASYSETRRMLAKKIGLGRKPGPRK